MSTQIIYLGIPKDRDLKNPKSYHGRLWSSALDLVEHSDGFERLYWGRCLEQPEKVQLHIGRFAFVSLKSIGTVQDLRPVTRPSSVTISFQINGDYIQSAHLSNITGRSSNRTLR